MLRVPGHSPAKEFQAEGVKGLFLEGLPWKGKPTRAFAWIGIPEHAPGEKVPAMVLVHGGGGTAFADWVRLWNKRGYAAIAMDTCGSVPGGELRPASAPRELGGPPGWGGFDQVDQPVEDQWTYHAVADVILAHSLLRARADVDDTRIGITGISWGGYLTCIVAGVDNRFRFAVPVYGCGFLGDNSTWKGTTGRHERALGQKVAKTLGSVCVYLPGAKMPFLWVDGTNDFAYPLDSVQKSYRVTPGAHTREQQNCACPTATAVRAEDPEEIRTFADAILRGGKPLARIVESGAENGRVWTTYERGDVVKAELLFTRDSGAWTERKWKPPPRHSTPVSDARVRPSSRGCATVSYLNLIDEQGRVVEHPAPRDGRRHTLSQRVEHTTAAATSWR